MPLHSNLREQAEGSLSDLQAAARNAVSPQAWLRTLINVVVVGLVFLGVLKLVKTVVPGRGKKVADRLKNLWG